MKYKRLIALLISIHYSFFSLADNEITTDSVNTTNFPDITFRVNLFNPAPKPKSAFDIQENGQSRDFTFNNIAPEIASETNKTVLIILEDMSNSTHPGQKKFYKHVLINSISQWVKNGDKVNIALFDRSRDGKNVLRHLLPEYTDDTSSLINEVKIYPSKDDRWYRQKSSDLYNAIYDGLNELKDKDPENKRFLLVLSAGYNNPASNETKLDRSIDLARRHRIPIYSVQYFLWEHRRLTSAIESTYGREIFTKDKQEATSLLLKHHKMGKHILFSFLSKINLSKLFTQLPKHIFLIKLKMQ